MVEQVEQNKNSASNIQIAEFTQEDTGFQSIKFFFTYHIKIEDESFEQAFQKLEGLKPLCNKFIWGEEYGKSGNTPHIQGAFILKRKSRATTLSNKFFTNGVSLFKLKSWEASITYCSKECNKIHTNVKLPKPLKKLPCEDNLLWWQEEICKFMEEEPDDRTVHWYWSAKGKMGKTNFGKYLHRKYGTLCLGGKSSDMKNGIIEFHKHQHYLPESIVINIPRSFNSDYLSYTGIEEVKDMFFYSGKYEGGMVDGNCPHVIILSNERPDETQLSMDRWHIVEIV